MTTPPTPQVRAFARYVFPLALIVPSLASTLSTAAEPNTPAITWREDLASAQAESRERDLPLWVQFTGPWCINCRRMDRDTFHHTKILEQSRDNFIPIKLRSDVHEQLAVSLGLSALPATVIVKPSGEVILSMEGYADPEELNTFLVQSLARDGRVTKAERLARARIVVEPIALAGYCPVSLVAEKKLETGKEPVSVSHEGRVYRFADEAKRDEFVRAPERYTPRHAGLDPVSQVDRAEFRPGDPRYGMLYRGQLFLFADEASRKAFTQNPDRYSRMQYVASSLAAIERTTTSAVGLRKSSRDLLGQAALMQALRSNGQTRVK